MTVVPASAVDITADWLREAANTREFENLVSVSAARLGEGVGMTTEIWRLTLAYADGARRGPKTLLARLLPWGGRGRAAARTGPKALVAKLQSGVPQMRDVANAYGLYEREVVFYRDIAPTISLRSPRWYVAEYEPSSHAFVLVMEDLSAMTPGDQIAGLTLDQLKMAIDQVSGLHARWWNRAELKGLEERVQPMGVAPYHDYNARHAAGWETFDRFLAGRVSPETRRVGERLCHRLDGLIAEMMAGPRTLCHGDFRADNMMFAGKPGRATGLSCVDWQLALQAPGPFDIGYMMSASVDAKMRRRHEKRLLRGYHKRLRAAGVEGYSFKACLLDYRRALLIGFTYLSQSGAAADLSHPRTLALYEVGMGRIDAAIREQKLAQLLG